MTRVVVVTAQPPAAEGGAAGRCVLAMLRGLRGHGVDVRAVAPQLPYAVPADPPADLDVTVVPLPAPGPPPPSRLSHLWRPLPDLADPRFADVVRAAAADADLVHLDQVETAPLLRLLPAAVSTLVHLHYRARLDAGLGAPWRPEFRHRLEFALAERDVLRRADRLLATSAEVAATLRSGRTAVEVVPMPLDVADYPVATHGDAPVAGVIGTGSWAPTAGALRRLVDGVWPGVRRRRPDAQLAIAGRGTSPPVDARPAPGVRSLGEVASAAEFLQSLAVLAYPPSRGSGVKVKVLEALACGVPVVTTPAGAEGLGPNDGLLVETGDDRLAEHVARLLGDADERRQRGAAARAYVERVHAPLPATAALRAVYARALG